MAGRDAMLRFASTVRDAGAALAVDDVPGGHDRLMTMAILRPEVVKLDGDTLQRSCADAGERLRLEAAVALAREYGSVLVAEGIEEPAHVEMALRLGAEIGQGFGLGVPLRCPLEDVRPYQRRAA
jgi:EAL domain-containing protein (putative c-di-GMP-specific phosphodiesterase class I)